MLKAKAFFWANTHNFFYGTGILGTVAPIPYYTTVVYGFDAMANGAIIPPRELTMFVTSACASLYVIAPGYRRPMTIGMAIVAVALLALGQGYTHMALFGVPLTDFKWMAIILPLAVIGMGLASPTSNNAVLDLMPERIVTITGLRGTFRMTRGTVVVAVIVMYANGRPDHAVGSTKVYTLLAVLTVAVIVVAFGVPDTARQGRLQDQALSPAAR